MEGSLWRMPVQTPALGIFQADEHDASQQVQSGSHPWNGEHEGPSVAFQQFDELSRTIRRQIMRRVRQGFQRRMKGH